MTVDRRVSSADIAAAAGVSRATVSYVLNDAPGRRVSDAARRRILAAARDLGYVPNAAAIALRSGRSNVVLLQELGRVPEPGEEIIGLGSTGGLVRDALARAVRSWGMTLVTCGTDFPLAKTLRHLSPSLVIAPGGVSPEDQAALDAASIPWYANASEVQPVFWALSTSIAMRQVAHLRTRGHRRIAFLGTCVEAVSDVSRQRAEAVQRACAGAGMTMAETVELGVPGDESVQRMIEILARWRHDGVTAAVCFNDILVAVAARAARRSGTVVPGDLALIGVEDDASVSWLLDPPVTSVRLELVKLGEHLAAAGRARLDGIEPPALPSDLTPLMIRTTT